MNHHAAGRFPPLPPDRKRADIARLRLAIALESTAPSAGYQRWSRRTAVAVGAVVLTIGGGTAAAATILKHLNPEPATVTTSGRCYWKISTNFEEDFPGSTAAVATRSDGWTPDLVSNLVEMCAAEWRAGAVPQSQGENDPEPSSTGDYPIPELVPCVLPDGQAAVFPGDSATCDRLGLPGLLTSG